jgi:two-component system response regulator AtoC
MYILAGFAEHGGPRAGARLLVLDADPGARESLLAIVVNAGYAADASSSADEALALLERGRHGVLIVAQPHRLDDGVALARRIQRERADISVVLLAADSETRAALAALQSGVCDFMTTCFESALLAERLLDVVQRSFDGEARASAGSVRPPPSPSRDALRDVLVGDCTRIDQARQDVRRTLGRSTPILIQGEAGTEKLALARLLHAAGAAHEQPFVVVNTARGQGPDAAEEWLPGERSGTLFFSEVSSLDAGWQMDLVKLLSALGEGRDGPGPRIIAGLCQPPAPSWEGSALCRLFASLGSDTVLLPPLRERGRDIVLLAEHFAEQVRLEREDASLRITGAALEALSNYGWPGNVDELRLAVQHAASLCSASSIEVSDLPPCIALGATGPPDESGTHLRVQSLQDMELAYISRVLDAVGGNKASAARLLGVDRTTLYRKLLRQEQGSAVVPSAVSASEVSPSEPAPSAVLPPRARG